jgi:hypothetical protein
VVDLIDEASIMQLLNLLSDKIMSLDGLLSAVLLDRLALEMIFKWCFITSLGIL